jgi:endonuclease IV
MNLAKKENEKSNLVLAEEALRFADLLKAEQVVFHPGVEGDIDETIRQLKQIGDKRIVIENKPYISVDGKYVCNGFSPEDIKRVSSEAGVGICLDFGHAICAANSLKKNPMETIRQFTALSPALYHINDSDYNSPVDSHKLHLGQGSFPLKELIGLVPDGARVTCETVKNSTENLDDFRIDAECLLKPVF